VRTTGRGRSRESVPLRGPTSVPRHRPAAKATNPAVVTAYRSMTGAETAGALSTAYYVTGAVNAAGSCIAN